ncbi:MAG TPA: glycosyltransferase family 4 protein [Candidatus Krumholzibacteria bacterium]|nr:glycosyltransferase family 4 protein [Candidatus Krumholzibacteria bacterium]HRX51373.1 glycosyltransferase family 4 protein [Candidatus Krumholzibacteria bacterium]
MPRRRLAILSQPFDGVLPPHQNSIGIWIHEAARRLAPRHDVTVYLQPTQELRTEAVRDGVRYRPLDLDVDRRLQRLLAPVTPADDPHRPPYARRRHWLPYALRAGLDARRRGVEVIHVLNFHQFAPLLKRAAPRARVVLHMRCEWLSQVDRAWAARSLAACDAVVGCSGHVTGLIRERFPEFAERCRTIPNAIDMAGFTPGPDPDPARPPRLLAVGRVSPEKGAHVLVEAMRAVADARPDARLDVVGSFGQLPWEFLAGLSDDPALQALAPFYAPDAPRYADGLQARVQELGLGEQVTFTGGKPYEEVMARMRDCDVLINPSLSESFGRTPVEAMACARPVVGAAVGGMLDTIVDGETGRLVPAADPAALAAAVLELLADPDRRRAMGRAGRARAEAEFSWESVLTRIEALGEEVIGRG